MVDSKPIFCFRRSLLKVKIITRSLEFRLEEVMQLGSSAGYFQQHLDRGKGFASEKRLCRGQLYNIWTVVLRHVNFISYTFALSSNEYFAC